MAPGDASQVSTTSVPECSIIKFGRYRLFTISPLSEFTVNPAGRLNTGSVRGKEAVPIISETPSAKIDTACSISVPEIYP